MKLRAIWIIILILAFTWHIIMAVRAEYSENFDEAIYHMLWAFLFVFFIEKEMKDK